MPPLRHGRIYSGHPRRCAPQSVESDRKPAVQPGVDPRHKAGGDVFYGNNLINIHNFFCHRVPVSSRFMGHGQWQARAWQL